MFSFFFRDDSQPIEWILKPHKFPKDVEENCSSKVLLPYHILNDLSTYNIHPPYVFEIYHDNMVYKTVCSVLDFSLEEEEVIVPSWIFEQLSLDTANTVIIRCKKVEKGTGIKLLPHSVDFLEIENPKKELERTLTNYHVLSYGDEILLHFEEIGKCRFTITKIYPEYLDTIYIVDTDLNVDFDEPLGYKEKIENERTVMKYIEISNEDVKTLKMKKIGIFLDWEAVMK